MAIRKKYFSESNAFKASEYNKDVFIDSCGICNRKATEVHHIKFQSETDNDFIDGIYKNHKSNLVPLCERHHLEIHHPADKELIIFGFKANGNLDYTYRKHLKSFKIQQIRIF